MLPKHARVAGIEANLKTLLVPFSIKDSTPFNVLNAVLQLNVRFSG
jgi:hypothetical protein